MIGHTPGPWRLCGADRGGCICGMVWSVPADAVVAVAAVHDEDMGAVITDKDAINANACLIAAAPELLEAAEEALGLLAVLDPQHGITTQLRAAISKATQP